MKKRNVKYASFFFFESLNDAGHNYTPVANLFEHRTSLHDLGRRTTDTKFLSGLTVYGLPFCFFINFQVPKYSARLLTTHFHVLPHLKATGTKRANEIFFMAYCQ